MSCSLYTIISDMSLEQMRPRLENVNLEEKMVIYGETYPIKTVISDIHWGRPERDVLAGVLSFETVESIHQIDGTTTYVNAGRRVMFSMFQGPVSLHLASFTNRGNAERAAYRFQHILTAGEDEPSQIVFNCRISVEAIEDFLARHPHTKKVGGWEELDFVGVDEGSLHGGDLDQFDQTSRYDAHGRKKYIMVTLHSPRMTVRISVAGIVTFYGKMSMADALAWIRREFGESLT